MKTSLAPLRQRPKFTTPTCLGRVCLFRFNMAAASSGVASSATDAIVGIDADASGTASAAAATGGASKSPAILGEATEDILGHIRALTEQQIDLNNARKIFAKQLKNQSKKDGQDSKQSSAFVRQQSVGIAQYSKGQSKTEEKAD